MSTKDRSSRSGNWLKHLFWIVPAALAVLLAGGWYGVTCAVENAARRCLAEAGYQLFGQGFEPDELSYSLAEQELYIGGIRVKNPRGYLQDRPALRVNLILAQVAPQELLFKRVVHLKKLVLSGIDINVELKRVPLTPDEWRKQLKDPEINLLELKKVPPVSVGELKRRKEFEARQSAEPLRFRIDQLCVETGAALLCNFTIFPEKWRTLPLDRYEQKDLGRNSSS